MLNIIGNTLKRIKEYFYDTSVDIKDRSFILFSAAALFSLFLAIPCGIIIKEPVISTLSSIAGFSFFTTYLIISYKMNQLDQAKKVIAILMIFIYLPGMFFTNGGIYGGTPVWLILGMIYICMILEGKFKIVLLIVNSVITLGCCIVGYLFPDLIINFSTFGNFVNTIAAFIIVSGIIITLISFQIGLYKREEEKKQERLLFEQTTKALIDAIDAKDTYTHGHSARVAEYSKKLAEMNGKSKSECIDVYFAALLHDVGKIGIPVEVINKEGKLTDEEYEIIKEHTIKGSQILQSISEYPSFSICALSHHERYDGKGYPHGLKGEEINETARIIAIADAYDAMTSKRSYRTPIPQQKAREELIKGSGTQFDPDYAKLMVHLIDLDSEFEMRERQEVREIVGRDELAVGEYRSSVSEGLLLTQNKTFISMKVNTYRSDMVPTPSLILFDSLDGRFHTSERDVRELHYFEYGEIWFDGYIVSSGARKMQMSISQTQLGTVEGFNEYLIEAVRVKDHVLIQIIGKERTVEITVALPDSTRYAYIGITGKYCRITELKTEKAEEPVNDDYIPRIAEEISYINGPAGDIPNIQIDSYRTDATKGIEITDGLQLTFHAMTLPTARLVWHCPFIVLFNSDNGMVNGNNYREYAMIRYDGECWDTESCRSVVPVIEQESCFVDWDTWKESNKQGYDSTVSFGRNGSVITVSTRNAGVIVNVTADIEDTDRPIYAAITGDQCAITNIKIIK